MEQKKFFSCLSRHFQILSESKQCTQKVTRAKSDTGEKESAQMGESTQTGKVTLWHGENESAQISESTQIGKVTLWHGENEKCLKLKKSNQGDFIF